MRRPFPPHKLTIDVFSFFSDYIFKTLVVGDAAVGKTCLITRFVEGKFNGEQVATIGVDFVSENQAYGECVLASIGDF